MQPYIHNFPLYRGEDFEESWYRDGVTSAVGWSAALDVRETQDEASTRYIGLTSSNGIALSYATIAGVGNLEMTITIAAALTVGATWRLGYYDLKLTRPDGKVEYLFRGEVSLIPQRTP